LPSDAAIGLSACDIAGLFCHSCPSPAATRWDLQLPDGVSGGYSRIRPSILSRCGMLGCPVPPLHPNTRKENQKKIPLILQSVQSAWRIACTQLHLLSCSCRLACRTGSSHPPPALCCSMCSYLDLLRPPPVERRAPSGTSRGLASIAPTVLRNSYPLSCLARQFGYVPPSHHGQLA
jgi:hypothetical protein